MAKFDIFGVSGEMNTTFNEKFDIILDDENFFAETKEVYTHEEDGLKFKYKYCIEGCKFEGNTYYALMVVPTPESLHKKHYESVCDCCGVDEPDLYDIASEGTHININTHQTKGTEDEEYDMNILDQIANTIDMTETFFGFHMDRPFNMLGITKWNLLQDFINGEDWSKKIG